MDQINSLKIIAKSYSDKQVFKKFLNEYFTREIKKLVDNYFTIAEIKDSFYAQLDWLEKIKLDNMEGYSYSQLCDIKGFIIPKLSVEEIRHLRANFNNAIGFLNNDKITEKVIETGTRKIIEKEFQTLGDWYKVFQSEEGYNTYFDLLIDFFDNGVYKTEKHITINNGNKTKVAHVLKLIHQKATNYSNLTKDTGFHEIVRVLHGFEEMSLEQIVSILQRPEKIK